MNKIIFKNLRAALTIEHSGSRSLGHCYSEITYRVTTTQPLSLATLLAFREAGLVGVGQEFSAYQVLSGGDRIPVGEQGSQNPSGIDMVNPQRVDEFTGKPIASGIAINPYSGKLYAPHAYYNYVYECVTRCDSGD